MTYDVKVFSEQKDELGEGLIWHDDRKSLFWLDISRSMLFEKQISSNEKSYDKAWSLPEPASSIAKLAGDTNSLIMVTDKSFGKYNLITQKYTPLVQLPYDSSFRSNDGAVSPDGSFWFGSMEKQPTTTAGSVYSINSLGELTCQYKGIGIPNTFCWNNMGTKLLLSDSLKQRVFQFNCDDGVLKANSKKVFVDYSDTQSTPDGGAIDFNENFWNALWGGGKIVCRDDNATLVDEIELPVLQPTNCCFGGEGLQVLFITSAREGLSDKLLAKYPLSGSVFMVKLNVKGKRDKSFTYR